MCGFLGILNLNRLDFTSTLRKKVNLGLQRLSARGPDAQQLWSDNNCLMAHARLSVIDLSEAAHQPMQRYGKTIVYNGEIYNFTDLRLELETLGRSFFTNSDTEVLLVGWSEWGRDLLPRLKGMFSFALWDSNEKKLVLARDAIGKKPLLYTLKENCLYFASDLKTLELLVNCGEVDDTALHCLFMLRYIPDPLTIRKDVKKLEAGNLATFDSEGLNLFRWYNLNNNILKEKYSFEGAKTELRETFDKAVKRRLTGDLPVGIFLSGGLDSSLIAASIAEQGVKLPCFSVGFEGVSDYYEERPEARKLAKYLGLSYTELEISANSALNAIPEMFSSLDEPFADSSSLPTYLLSKEVKKHLTVAMSGDGGDEVFGGYRKYFSEKWHFLSLLFPSFIRPYLISVLQENKDTKVGEISRRLSRFLENHSGSSSERHAKWLSQIKKEDVESLFDYPCKDFDLVQILYDLRKNFKNPVNAMLYADLCLPLVSDMLVKVDRMSMAHGLEVRSPFLDQDLVELAFSFPGNFKLGCWRGKKILREAFSDRLPIWVSNRKKKGFEIPIANWLTNDLKGLLDDACSQNTLKKINIKNISMVEKWKRQLLYGKKDTSWQLWTLISYVNWARSRGIV